MRVATYNILNTKDRYDEREWLLKRNLYELNADIIGLQEVVYGSKQLNELLCPIQKQENSGRHKNRHNINLKEIKAEKRADGYTEYKGPV